MRDFALAEWQRAQQALASAERLAADDPEGSASRAYYAAFHAATALFALEGRSFSKHSGLRAAVHRDLVRTGRWLPGLGRDLDFLMDLREAADYGGLTRLTPDAARVACDKARALLGAVRDACPDLASAGR